MHVDPDLLSLHALGEDVLDPTDGSHLQDCGRCRSDAAAMRQAVAYARVADDSSAGGAGDAVLSSTGPSPRVWGAITTELGLSADLTAGPRSVRTTRPRQVHRPTRWRSVVPLAVAASTGAVMAAGATWAWLSREQPQPTPQLAARLAPLTSGGSGEGQAQVVAGGGGQRALALAVDRLPATPGYHEVWLIDVETGRMVSLGPVDGTADGTLTGATVAHPLPTGLDLADFDVVDISDEPLDGDPLHSGVSLLRGTLA